MEQQNIVYFSGAHSTGKTTLINKLVETNPRQYKCFKKLAIPKSDDAFERAKIRTVRFYLQTFYQESQAKRNPEHILLCDRCIIDNLGYMGGFLDIDWVSEEELNQFTQLYKILLPAERMPKNVVYLDPPLDVIIRNIKNRWKVREKKWREDNFEYLAAVHLAYQNFFSAYQGNVLHIQTMDLKERIELFQKWIVHLPKSETTSPKST